MGGTAPDSFSGDMGGIWFEPVNSGCCDSWLRTKPGSNLAKVPGQCGLEQQELAHAIHRDHSNQPTGTDHRQRMTIAVLHSSEDLFNQLSWSCGLEACLHSAAGLSLQSLIVFRLLPDLWLGGSSGFTWRWPTLAEIVSLDAAHLAWI